MQVNKIIILGGGSAGWMAASALINDFPDKDITLIEASDIPTIGVGESTLSEIHKFIAPLGIAEEDWMPACDATYKLSVDFTNWDGKGTRVHYPFGKYQRYIEEHSPLVRKEQWFERKTVLNSPVTEWAEFLHDHIELLDNSKYTDNSDGYFKNLTLNRTGLNLDKAYHFNATLFGQWLKTNFCMPKGVKHVVGTCNNVVQDEHGYVDYINLEGDDKNYHADLFIDCSGFHSILLEKVYNVPFHSFKDALLNDKALATTIPYTDKNIEMEVTTNATTMNAGWCWNIPLYNRIGTGYVYSSQFLTDDEAEKEFREYLLKHRKPFANLEPQRDFLKINIRSGVREEPWIKNVVAVGLSSGFIEPLESTGLVLTHKNIQNIVKVLKLGHNGKQVTGFLRQSFNTWVHKDMSLVGFIILHYAFAQRNDTEYWRYVTEEVKYDGSIFKSCEGIDWIKSAVLAPKRFLEKGFSVFDGNEGISTIMAGFDFNPLYLEDLRESADNANIDWDSFVSFLKKMDNWLIDKRNRNKDYVNTLPSHYEWLKQHIYNGRE